MKSIYLGNVGNAGLTRQRRKSQVLCLQTITSMLRGARSHVYITEENRMSQSNEPYAVQPESGTADEGTGNGPSADFEFVEIMQLRASQDQHLASSRDDLKRSTKRLLKLLEMDAPSNMLFRELAIQTQRIGIYQNSLLDVSAP